MIDIADDNLKLALVQALLHHEVLAPFDRSKFILEHNLPHGEGEGGYPEDADPDENPDYRKVHEIESELLSWLEPKHLPLIEYIHWAGGQDVQHWIWTFWDGESDEFDITDLTGIASLTALRSLSLVSCCSVHDLAPLTGMATLETLVCCGTSKAGAGVRDVRPLASLPNLRRLDLDYHRELRDLSSLAGHPTLSELNVNHTAVEDLSFALTLPKLTKLDASLWGGSASIAAANASVIDALRARGVKTTVW